MTAPHLHLVTTNDDALYVGRLEAANATLAEELSQAQADIELLREGNAHLLEQYAAVVERLTDALEYRWAACLCAIAAAMAFVMLLRIAS